MACGAVMVPTTMFMGQVVTAFASQQGQAQTISISQQPLQQQEQQHQQQQQQQHQQQHQQQPPQVTAMQPGQAPLAQQQTQFIQVTLQMMLTFHSVALFVASRRCDQYASTSSQSSLPFSPKAPRLLHGNQSTQLILQAAFPLQQQGPFAASAQPQQQLQQLQQQQQKPLLQQKQASARRDSLSDRSAAQPQ